MKYADREEAGIMLGGHLEKYKKMKNTVVLGLPRGGVVIAFEIARKLQLPMDVLVIRKIAAPGNPEFAIGAIDEHGEGLINEEVVRYYEIPHDYIDEQLELEKAEAQRRLKAYRGNRPPLDLKGKTVILADDGIATGFTMKAAIMSLKSKGAKRIVVAVPVAPPETITKLKREVDEMAVLYSPAVFMAVGEFYKSFPQLDDEDVIDVLYNKSLKSL